MIFTKSFNQTVMKKFISAALVVAMTAASCANKEDLGTNNENLGNDNNDNITELPSEDENQPVTSFTADFGDPMSKALPSYSDKTKTVTVLWEAYDKVGVYTGQEGPAEFTAQTEGASTTLKGSVGAADTYYAMYPYDENASFSAGQISTVLPAEQTATSDEFAAHLAVASTTGSSLSFQNVCALVRVYVGCEHVTKIEFKGNNNEVVAGDIVVDAATAKFSLGTTQEKEITVTPPAGDDTFEIGAYYFSVLPQNFTEGFTVTYYTTNGNIDTRSTEAVNVQRSNLVVGRALTAIAGEGSADSPFIVANVHDLCCLSEVLLEDSANYVELANDIDMSGVETWTPINNDRTAANVREIHFDGKDYIISNFAPTTFTNAPDGKTNYSLFGVLYGSCKNLTIEDAVVDQASSSTTAVLAAFGGYTGVGAEDKTTTIENVSIVGSISANKVVGALVGQAANLTVKRCSLDVSVECLDDDCAALIGRANSGKIVIEECRLNGSLVCAESEQLCFGGFIGNSETGVTVLEIKRCLSNVDVTGDYQVGGLVGLVNGTATQATIEDCVVTAELSSMEEPLCGKQFGGIIGTSKASKLNISRCWYSGDICAEVGTGTTKNNKKNMVVGGLLGLNAGASSVEINISNSFVFSTTIDADKDGVGGIVGGSLDGALNITNSYALATIQCELQSAKVGAIVGKVTAGELTLSGCKHNMDMENLIGDGAADSTPTNSGKLTEAEASAYTNASAVATALGWSTETWNLTGTTPTLKCFE